jgi:hypothetical protein
MPFDKTKFMNTLRGKLPSNDVFELTMAQKTMVKTHLKSVNGRKKCRKNGGSLATANSLINHDYLPRLNANEAKQEATKGLIILALGVVMVFGTEMLINQTANATPGVDWKKYHGEGKTLSLKNKPDNDNQKED